MARNRASAKKAGTAFETELASYLTESLGLPVKRRAKTGAVDLGDLMGVTHKGREIAIECKSPGQNTAWSIAGWWKETETEASNLGAPFGILFVRRYRKNISESLVVLDEDTAILLGVKEKLEITEEKAIGFKKLADLLVGGNVVVSPRRGEESHWYLTTTKDILPFLDSANDAEQAYVDEESLAILHEEGKVVIPNNSGGVVMLTLR